MPLNVAELKRRRKAKGYTLERAAELANAAGQTLGNKVSLTRQRWQSLEAGNSTDLKLSTLEAIVTVLDCGVDDLRTNPPVPTSSRDLARDFALWANDKTPVGNL